MTKPTSGSVVFQEGYIDGVEGEAYDVDCYRDDPTYAAGYAAGQEDRDYPEFVLRNDPPKRSRERYFDNDRTLQKVFIDGLDCDPDQQDLF